LKQIITYLLCFISFYGNAQDYLHEIEYQDDFTSLESVPLSQKYSNVGAVKVIYDIENDKFYFINSRYFKFHYDFCMTQLGFRDGLSEYNNHNYKESPYRKYYLATINHYRDADIYTFEFSTSDVLSQGNIIFFKKVKQKVYFGEELKMFPSGANQLDFIKKQEHPISFITADFIYKNLNYQALNITFSYGILRFVDMDTFDTKNIEKNDIVVINGTPNEMPFCRGIITTDFQPPLSHIVILSHNRRTPIMALKTAWTEKDLIALNGKKVKFTVSNSYYTVTKASDRATQTYFSNRDRKRVKKLKVDLKIKGIQSLNSLSRHSVKYVGGKAANFGELNRIYFNSKEKLVIPKAAFAIPFYHYQKHIDDNGIDILITELIENTEIKNDLALLEKKLKTIRKAIKKSKFDSKFLSQIENLIEINGIKRLRFRSSTNAEDIKGFNGAGLYDSKTGILGNNKKRIDEAIKKVWASLWNLRAFQEREFFKIDQNTVAMGVLIHQSFPNEEVNGVAITKNIYRTERTGFVVNLQKGDVSLVIPPNGVTSELFIIKHNISAQNKMEIDYISYSSLNNNEALLKTSEIIELNRILAAIKLHFFNNLKNKAFIDYQDFAMDIEFKIEEKTRQIVVKQARIY